MVIIIVFLEIVNSQVKHNIFYSKRQYSFIFQLLSIKESAAHYELSKADHQTGWAKEYHSRFTPVFSFTKHCTISARSCQAGKKLKYWL